MRIVFHWAAGAMGSHALGSIPELGIALSLPSIPGLRVPLFCIKKAFQVEQNTMGPALQVLVLSFQQLALGQHPSQRHDGGNLDAAKQKCRINVAGQPLPFGLLAQIRGDWNMMKDTLGMPAHNENRGLCRLCNCTPGKVHQVGLEADWRKNYCDERDFVMRCWQQQRHMTPIRQSH